MTYVLISANLLKDATFRFLRPVVMCYGLLGEKLRRLEALQKCKFRPEMRRKNERVACFGTV